MAECYKAGEVVFHNGYPSAQEVEDFLYHTENLFGKVKEAEFSLLFLKNELGYEKAKQVLSILPEEERQVVLGKILAIKNSTERIKKEVEIGKKA